MQRKRGNSKKEQRETFTSRIDKATRFVIELFWVLTKTTSLFLVAGVLLVSFTFGAYNSGIESTYDNDMKEFRKNADVVEKMLPGNALTAFNINRKLKTHDEEYYEEIKVISDFLVKDCSSKECIVRTLFDSVEVNNIRRTAFNDMYYSIGNNIDDPLLVWYEKKGDCDELSNLLMHFLAAQGIKSKVQVANDHAWLVIFVDGKKVVADPTKHVLVEVNE